MTNFASENLHSQTVTGLKIVLPLLGLAILSTLFLISTSTSPDDPVPYADVDIKVLLREPRLTGPSYAGMTADGAALTLSAREALPGVPGTDLGGLARDLSGSLETPDGVMTTVTAGEARLDLAGQQVHLSGGVHLTMSSGYALSFETGSVALEQTHITASGGITATGPMGSLTAASVDIGPAEDDPKSYLTVFKGGVRLLYQP